MSAQEKAMQICAIVFYDLQHPEKICNYFSCIPKGTIDKKLLTEYLAYRAFIADYSLYAFANNKPDYADIKHQLFDVCMPQLWNDLYSEGLISQGIDILNDRFTIYTEIYSGDEPNDSKKIGFSCARVLNLAGFYEHLKSHSSEYTDFRFEFFDSATLALIKQIHEICNESAASNSAPTGNIGCGLLILFIILAYIFSK